MTRLEWPGGARCAVVVTVNLDAEHFWLQLDESCRERPKTLSMGEYGPRRGVPRVLDALDEAGVTASWLTLGAVARRYPGVLAEIARRGHDIGCRGYGAEDLTTHDADGQRELLTRAGDEIEKVIGRRPTGFRPLSREVTNDTAGVLDELGYTWTSMARGDDRPYYLHTPARRTDVVEIPASWELDDFSRFMFNYGPPFPKANSRIAGYAQVLEDWRLEFDAYHHYGLCAVLTVDPSSIGKPGRIGLLEELLAHMREPGDVWFATGAEVAAWWRSRAAANDPGDPETSRLRL
ncbi:polysaccharide deacetylase [Nonomuraea sp. NPDC050404]|uniref:polysaccharide deacetylase family protein n=1 Tax=Nonomuraea sp. NPDC050404 TaxID=3155783 RepID=UPI0033E36CB4